MAKEMKSHYKGEISIIGFIDVTNPNRNDYPGVPVLGKRNIFPVSRKTPGRGNNYRHTSAGGSEKKIFDICRQTKAKVKTLPVFMI